MISQLSFISVADVLSLVFFLVIAIVLSKKVRGSKRLFSLLTLLHLVTTLFYFFYSLRFPNGSDSTVYYSTALSHSEGWLSILNLQYATSSVHFLCYPLIHLFGLHYFGCFIIFSIIGLIGWTLILEVALDLVKPLRTSRWTYLLLLPQLHFWTCAIGKDSVCFLLISLIIYAWHFKRPLWLILLAIVPLAIIRVHVAGVVAVAFLLAALLSKRRYNLFTKLFIAAITTVGIAFIFNRFLETTKSESLSDVASYAESFTETYSDTGSFVDLSNSPIIVKMVAYLFRPFFFDARNVLTLEASVENLLWIAFVFTMLALLFKRKKRFSIDWGQLGFPLLSALLLLVGLSYGVSNLGIAMRQKTMIFPFLLYGLLYLTNLDYIVKKGLKTLDWKTAYNK